MTPNYEELELKDRLNLIESMISEGRRTTESWGWIFVLWGIAYYVAIAWSAWGHHYGFAWNVTMGVAMILMFGLIAWRIGGGKQSPQPVTTLTRAIFAVWIAVGTAFFVLLPSLGETGHLNSNLTVAIIGTLLGTANAASGIILKWKLQIGCALVWWALTIISCFGTTRQSFIALLVANFFCQIVFGFYGMICESRIRRQREARHA